MATPRPSKVCPVCGRRFEWRKKWERDWDAVKYCSDRCRRQSSGGGARDDFEASILALLRARPRGATICPSEVARGTGAEDWRKLMEPVRAAARRLAAGGTIVVTQGGKVVDPSTARGAIRLRLK